MVTPAPSNETSLIYLQPHFNLAPVRVFNVHSKVTPHSLLTCQTGATLGTSRATKATLHPKFNIHSETHQWSLYTLRQACGGSTEAQPHRR